MFFGNQNLNLRLLEAFVFRQGKTVSFCRKRSFCALSFRLYSKNAVFSWKGGAFNALSGDLIFTPANLDYERKCDADEVIVAHFMCDDLGFSGLERFTPQESKAYEPLFLRLVSAYESKPNAYAATAVLYEILALVAEECGQEQSVERQKIADGLARMNDGFADPAFSVAQVSRECGLSEVSFRAMFEKVMGVKPIEYLTKLKIDKAIRLLSVGGFKMEEIAEQVGYCDAKYFATVFKKVVGVSPRRYRAPSPADFDGVQKPKKD